MMTKDICQISPFLTQITHIDYIRGLNWVVTKRWDTIIVELIWEGELFALCADNEPDTEGYLKERIKESIRIHEAKKYIDNNAVNQQP